MTRFVVRPTGPSESDGYSVIDTNREDERGKQIGRGLSKWTAATLADALSFVDESEILSFLRACADAHDDYLSDEEKRANREAHERDSVRFAHREKCLRHAILDFHLSHHSTCGSGGPDCDCGATLAEEMAREALGE